MADPISDPATPDRRCESCSQPADVVLDDGSTWCWSCDGSARRLGYDDAPISEVLHRA